jgi:hypothetical protein
VRGCWIDGEIIDLRNTINPETNVLHAPNPQFDKSYTPLAKEYSEAGYRPVKQER